MNIACATHAGCVHPQNEDSIYAYGKSMPVLAILADGMGGHAAGRQASASTIKYIRRRLKEESLSEMTTQKMRSIAEDASTELFRQAEKDEKLSGMGTTLVFALIDNTTAKIVNVGDSRAYLFADGSLRQLTKDHSYVQYLYDHNLLTQEELRVHPYRNIIMRAVGMEQVEADEYEIPIARGDTVLLCSDGLTEELEDAQIAEILGKRISAKQKAEELISRALAHGGRDNISVILVENKGIVGEVLQGKYEVRELIAEGGMSRVYQGKCLRTGKDVAIKMFKPEFLKVPEAVEGFKMEAKTSAMLHHPNLMHAIDVGKRDKFRYIVSDFVHGTELKQMLKGMTTERSVEIVKKVLSGIGYAHRRGIVHQDLKPHNILLTESDEPVIIDFGIAQTMGKDEEPREHQVLGTVDYFSPEQAKGDSADARSDLYSIGVILYEMCTGRLPFQGKDDVQVALMHLHQPVIPPKELNPELPESLNKVILKALEKDPADRYQTAAAMRADLERVFEEPDGDYILLRNETEEKHVKPKLLPVLLGIGICAMLMLALSVLLIRFVGNRQQQTEVEAYMPYLLDKTEDEARKLLADYRIQIYYEENPGAEVGSVVSQSPDAGTTIQEGDEVSITVTIPEEEEYGEE